MKKYYLSFLALLYMGTDVLIKAAEDFFRRDSLSIVVGGTKSIEGLGSFANKSGNTVYIIKASADLSLGKQIKPGDEEEIGHSVVRLCVWDRNLKTVLRSDKLEKLEKVVLDNLDKKPSEIDFSVKPYLVFQVPSGSNKTINVKFKDGALEPRQGKGGRIAGGYLVESSMNSAEINECTWMFREGENDWMKASAMMPSRRISRFGRKKRSSSSLKNSGRPRCMSESPVRAPLESKELERRMSDPQLIEANFQFKNEGGNSILILVTNGRETEAMVLDPGENCERISYGSEIFTQLFMWVDNADEEGLDIPGLVAIVKANMGKKIAKIDFGLRHCPDYFTILPQDKLQLLSWKNGKLSPQKRKKTRGYDDERSLSNNIAITSEDIEARLWRRTSEGEWASPLVSALSNLGLSKS